MARFQDIHNPQAAIELSLFMIRSLRLFYFRQPLSERQYQPQARLQQQIWREEGQIARLPVAGVLGAGSALTQAWFAPHAKPVPACRTRATFLACSTQWSRPQSPHLAFRPRNTLIKTAGLRMSPASLERLLGAYKRTRTRLATACGA
jgi:hypothetical protein